MRGSLRIDNENDQQQKTNEKGKNTKTKNKVKTESDSRRSFAGVCTKKNRNIEAIIYFRFCVTLIARLLH